jgi:uncharacterized protein
MLKQQNRMSRRKFLLVGGLALAGASAALVGHVANNNEVEQLGLEQITLPIKGLHPALDGFRIVQLTDIHLGDLTKAPFAQEAVDLANSLQPDLTVLTGDYVWHEVDVIFELAPILAGLNARHGVYAIMGNHELWEGVEIVKTALREVRLPYLINQGVTISQGNGRFYLAGLDDGWSGAPDLNAALVGAPADAPVVLLLHEPDLADEYAHYPNMALQLAGHSHGGQVRLPFIGAPILPPLGRKYDMGLYKVGEMWLYTSRGIGVTHEPIRFNCPPEVTEITLTVGS